MRRISKEWIINNKTIRLSCKTEEQVNQLTADVKSSLCNDLNLANLPYDKYDIFKIISLLFKDLGITYFKKSMNKLHNNKGKFGKQVFLYEILNNGIKFDWQRIFRDTDLMEFFSCFDELANESILNSFNIEGYLKKNQPFIDILEKLPPRKILQVCYSQYYELFISYIQYFCREYTNKFEIVYYNRVLKDIFGKKYTPSEENRNENNDLNDISQINNLLHDIVNKEYDYQCKYFIETNRERMRLDNDTWFMFYLRGVSLKRREFNFTKIISRTLKQELKLYFKEDRFKYKTNFKALNSNMNLLFDSLNFLVINNPCIEHFADIEFSDVVALGNYLENDATTYRKDSVSVRTIAYNNGIFRAIIKFLINYANETNKDTKLYYPVPLHNPFYDLEYRNLDNMQESTDVIPEEVMNQLKLHIGELRSDYRNLFEIFSDTGIRADDALLLEYDCINDMTNEFRYTPHKIRSARRKHKYEDRKMLIISDKVKSLIKDQIEHTTDLRQKFNSPYIFLNNCKSTSRAMPSRSGFANAINTIIKKYDIRDLDNNLWHFTCRQMRKTVAEIMILNNASPFEVQYQMGHLHFSTTIKHYAEIEKKKLADMNTDFFSKEFEVTIGKENLEKFTEEERRALYVDFRLNYRDVELGKCTKHYSEQPCSKITGQISCATCPKCATGKKYLPKWVKLRDSQKQLIENMIEGYHKENITNYETFIEYKREIYFLNTYNDIIDKISKESRC